MIAGPQRDVARDVLVAAVWFVVVGVVAGVAWWQLSPDVVATRADTGVVLEGPQLERQVGADGWYGALAVAGGLVSGVALTWWRSARPTLMVGLVALGALGAGLAALWLGALLGPDDPRMLLASAPVGTTAPVDLRLQAEGLLWAWPACALAGALAFLVVRGPLDVDPRVRSETAPVDPAAR
ncbi:hypothetical protein GCM10028771_33610 [Nocardioides marmoraquaticus]